MAAKDYYKTLGLTKSAFQEDIKKAYRKLAMKHHPDRNAGDKKSETLFKEINEAYAILGDAEKKSEYDNGGFTPGFGGSGFSRSSHGDMHFDADTIFREFFGGRKGFSDFNQSISYDIEYILPISFEQSVLGGEMQVNINRYDYYRTNKEKAVEKLIKVKIPAGISEGMRIKFNGEGNSKDNNIRGDLYLEIKVMSPVNNKYIRKDFDLFIEQDISFATATLGGEITIKSITGDITMKVPEYTANGKTLRVKGKGIRHLKGDGIGDLYVKLNVVVPTSLNEKQKELLKKFATI